MKLKLILKNWEAYKYWRARKKGREFMDHDRGCGYYTKYKYWETKMESGRIGIYKLIDYEMHMNPGDMIKHAWYMFIGYKSEKPISECTFEEFLNIYKL
jgi:hypothetical protein